ncbi:MAG: radical SAM protein [Candidatus Heimdallarchaeota archaeon]|nr:radical SAM protein [Candidatus Heimdallarchaeota archaeon]
MTVPYPIAVVDATAAGKGKRQFTRDAIGCGVRSVCGILEQNDIASQILLAEDILEKGFQQNYSALFLSGMSMDISAIRKIIAIWRKNFQSKVVVGGPITSELEDALVNTTADLIVIGEGEFTLQELIDNNFLSNKNSNSLESISGIGYFDKKNNPKVNSFRRYSSREEFRTFNASTKKITDYPHYFFAKVYVECVRGCSNFGGTRIKLPDGRECSECGSCDSNNLEARANCPSSIPPGCGFCSVPSLYGPSRSKPVDLIVNEVKELLNLGVKRIVLSAPDFLDYERDAIVSPKPLINPTTPAANLTKIEELLGKLTLLSQVSHGKAWIEVENIKASLFTEDVAKLLSKYLPGSPFSIGCETGSVTHARLLGRPSDPYDTLRAVTIASKYELKAHVYFIHGLPGQTKQTAIETAKLIHKISPFIEKVTIYRFKPLPLSAFGDFEEPVAAVKNPISQIISDAANEVNLSKKKDFVGEILRVIISEINYRDETGTIAYILSGGPMVAVPNSRDKIGEIVDVKITKVLSDKLLYGVISVK